MSKQKWRTMKLNAMNYLKNKEQILVKMALGGHLDSLLRKVKQIHFPCKIEHNGTDKVTELRPK